MLPLRLARMAASRRRRRLVRAFAMAGLVAMFATSCSGFDVKPAISVRQVPLDIKFGAKKQEAPKPPEFQTPVTPIIEVPDIEAPPPPVAPVEVCRLTKVSVRDPAINSIKAETPFFGGIFPVRFQQWDLGEDAPEETEVYGRLPTPEEPDPIRPGPPVGLLRQDCCTSPAQPEPPGRYVIQSDSNTGIVMRFQIAYGDDSGRTDPNVGFFLERIGIPDELGAPPANDDSVSQTLAGGGDGLIKPEPKLKLFTFAIQLTDEFEATGYDPFTRTVVQSHTRVIEDDSRIWECDERVAGYKVAWQLTFHGTFEHEITGHFWFATQYNGLIVKSEYCMHAPGDDQTDGFLASGCFRSNIHNLGLD